jgi:hypothetical protein
MGRHWFLNRQLLAHLAPNEIDGRPAIKSYNRVDIKTLRPLLTFGKYTAALNADHRQGAAIPGLVETHPCDFAKKGAGLNR